MEPRLLNISGVIINPVHITNTFPSQNGDLEVWFTGNSSAFFTGHEARALRQWLYEHSERLNVEGSDAK